MTTPSIDSDNEQDDEEDTMDYYNTEESIEDPSVTDIEWYIIL